MRISRKSSSCLNCGRTLDQVYNYCPNCGQGNHDDNVSFKTLVGDFFSTYLAVDSKFGRTVKPFFIDPGFITNEFVKGKRNTHAHPIRLYLIISIFYFFVFSMVANQSAKEKNEEKNTVINAVMQVDGVSEDASERIANSLKDQTLSDIYKDLQDKPFDKKHVIKVLDTNISEDDKEDLAEGLDSLTVLSLGWPLVAQENDTEKSTDDSDEFILSRMDQSLIDELKDKERFSDQQILDSMHLGELSFFEQHVAYQTIRVRRASEEQIIGYIVKNLPLMMLILIPIFALLLKLLYIRRQELYIKHLIHGLHLHTFAYFLYGVSLIVMHFFLGDTASIVVGSLTFILVSTYAYISFLKVYKQHWFKTLVKFNLTGVTYIVAIICFALLELVISLLLF